MFKIAVLISGNGSNLEALIDACKKNVINGSVEIIISNNPDAYGIQRAKNHFITVSYTHLTLPTTPYV